MTLTLVNSYFLIGILAFLAFAYFVARTSYPDVATVENADKDLLPVLADEVERARRLGDSLTVARVSLRPGASTATLNSALRSIDTIVVSDDVVHLVLPGSTKVDPIFERIAAESEAVAAWSTATFPEDVLTIGELMLKVGDTAPDSRADHSTNAR